jgi:glutathione S-transferase
VPVLVDGEKTVADSWVIANYLEDRYPDRKSLFGAMTGRAPTRFIASWADGALLPAIAQLILIDVYAHLHEKDKAYFRESRQKRADTTLERFCAGRDETVIRFCKTLLAPLRLALG